MAPAVDGRARCRGRTSFVETRRAALVPTPCLLLCPPREREPSTGGSIWDPAAAPLRPNCPLFERANGFCFCRSRVVMGSAKRLTALFHNCYF